MDCHANAFWWIGKASGHLGGHACNRLDVPLEDEEVPCLDKNAELLQSVVVLLQRHGPPVVLQMEGQQGRTNLPKGAVGFTGPTWTHTVSAVTFTLDFDE